MLSEKEIRVLQSFAGSEDLASEAILKCLESGKELTIENIKSIIRPLKIESKYDNRESLDIIKNFSDHETTRHCKCCEKDLPIAEFFIFRYKNKNKEIVSHLCKSCHRKKNNENGKKKRATDINHRLLINAREKKRKQDNRLKKLFASKQYLKQAHAILDWRRSA